jgi:hypothetical protein
MQKDLKKKNKEGIIVLMMNMIPQPKPTISMPQGTDSVLAL